MATISWPQMDETEMNCNRLNTLTTRRSRPMARFLLAIVTCCCGVKAGVAQENWIAPGAQGGRYVQAMSYNVDSIDGQLTQSNPGDPPSAVYVEEYPGEGESILYDGELPDGELLDPLAYGSDCGYTCPPAWRADANYFLLSRGRTRGITLSNAFDVDDGGYKEGVRLSLARHYDCLDSFELTYMGPFEVGEVRSVTGVGLGFLPNPSLGITINSFLNATSQTQTYDSSFHSLEFNQKWVGWDVFTQTIGLRYWNVDHRLTFNSTSAAGSGFFGLEAENNALGFQYGIEMLYPLGRWEMNTWLKGGIYGNLVDLSAVLVDAGTVQFANSDDDLDFSTLAEFGIELSYRVLPNVTIQGGYEVWWLYGFYTGHDQLRGALTANTGRRIDTEDFWFHGGTLGVEMIW